MARELGILVLVFLCGVACRATSGLEGGVDATNAANPSDSSDGNTTPVRAANDGDVMPQSDSTARGTDDAPAVDVEAGVGLDAAIDAPSRPGWNLVWSDEFLGPTIDETTWVIANEAGNKPNNELQFYTSRKNAEPGANVFIENGALVLEAREEMYGDSGFGYTSGKVTTQGTRQFTYGRFEAGMKLPAVTGMWPAFWMLGSNITSVGWPASGEIDIMEGKGRLPNWMSGALHRGATRAQDIVSVQAFQLATGNFNDAWHVFALEWDAQQIRWYVDDVQFQAVGRPVAATAPWPFDQPFFFLLNLAVGGVFDANAVPPPGMPPQRVYVDYVRVYQKA